jgi:hypothetical protein
MFIELLLSTECTTEKGMVNLKAIFVTLNKTNSKICHFLQITKCFCNFTIV